jgi:hypothetical protein
MTRKPAKKSKVKAPAKKAAPAKKPAGKKPAPAKKTKKPEKSLPAKRAAAPAPPASKKRAPAKPAGKPAKAAKTSPKPKVAKPPAAKKKPVVLPTGVAKPGLGHKWACFNCGAKFYDLGKPIPVCPKCEADQRDRPAVTVESPAPPPQPKRPALAPMSRFLDDDEVAAPEAPDEFGAAAEDTEEPEAAEIDIESLEEPGGIAEGEFSEPEEE